MSVLKIKDSASGQWQGIASIQGEPGAKGETGGVNDAVKLALLRIANNVFYDEDGKSAAYVKALQDALFPPTNLVSIEAVYTQSGDVYDIDELDSLKADLVVTATMTDGTAKTIAAADYFLDGALKSGTQTITVSYGGQTTTFDVLVSRLPNGLVDGVYHAVNRVGAVSGETAIIADGGFTGVDLVSFYTIYVPLQNPIKLFEGDVVTFTNGAEPVSSSPVPTTPNPIINGDDSCCVRIGAYTPFYNQPIDGKLTITKDVIATSLRFDTSTAFNVRTFTMSLLVNGEVVF